MKPNDSDINQDDTITIEWNGINCQIRRGAKVYHLLHSEEYDLCQSGKAIILDQFGNETGLNGALTNGIKLYLKYYKNGN